MSDAGLPMRLHEKLCVPSQRPRARPTDARHVLATHALLLELQRTAGNTAVTTLVRRTVKASQVTVQRTVACPPKLASSDPVPSGFKPYNGPSCVFHCCYRGILEDRRPTPVDPQQECFYDDRGALVDENHENAGCRGTPNQYDSKANPWKHFFWDKGGVVEAGLGAFWSSRWRDTKEEGKRLFRSVR